MTSPVPTLGDFRKFTKDMPDRLPLHATLWAGPPIDVHGVSDERFGKGEDITAVVIQVHLVQDEMAMEIQQQMVAEAVEKQNAPAGSFLHPTA